MIEPNRGATGQPLRPLRPSGIAASVLEAIGKTPLVRLRRLVPSPSADVFVKLEYYNPTGSYKDRMALAMIEGAGARGKLRPGMRVVEYTGGSTGSSLALVCAVKAYPFTSVTSDGFAREKLQTMRALGAELHVVAAEDGKLTPGLFDRMKAEVAKLAAEPDTFYADQFHDPDAINGYRTIGEELLSSSGEESRRSAGRWGRLGCWWGFPTP